MTRASTITFFGNFGTHNLGNECTLRAIVQNTRKHLPTAAVNCVCTGPEVTAETHGIPAFLVSYRFGQAFRSPRGSDNPVKRLIRRLVIRFPLEVGEWLRAFRTLKGTDMLVMTGTGMLGDFGISPLDLHYEILKWSIVAKLRGCKLLFVSVGAGPIRHPLSRWIVKAALSLADYRSYRDHFSQEYLEFIGFDASGDRVYPDLAFSLLGSEPAATPRADRNGHEQVIGLGLMEYYGQHRTLADGERVYRRYIERVAAFAAWLLEQGHSVRLLVGDLTYDKRVKADLLRLLEESAPRFDRARIIDDPLNSPEDLYEQLAKTDMVVATRFHNVLLALMLGRPVIALSYHEKLRSLMAEVGASDYSVDAEDLDLPLLIERFRRLSEHAEAFRSSTKQRTDEYRSALDEQYVHIFGDLLALRSGTALNEGYEALRPSSSPNGVRGRVA
jgi:polysaccharide pyruvyl transferase WcaK-like protein